MTRGVGLPKPSASTVTRNPIAITRAVDQSIIHRIDVIKMLPQEEGGSRFRALGDGDITNDNKADHGSALPTPCFHFAKQLAKNRAPVSMMSAQTRHEEFAGDKVSRHSTIGRGVVNFHKGVNERR